MVKNFFLRLGGGLIGLILGLIFLFEILEKVNIWLDVTLLHLLIHLGVKSRLAAPMFVHVEGFTAEDYSFTAAFVITVVIPGIAAAGLLFWFRKHASVLTRIAFIAVPLISTAVSIYYLPDENESYIKGGRFLIQQIFSVSAAFFVSLALIAIVYFASSLPKIIRDNRPPDQF